MGITPGIHLFLLQDDWVFFKEDNPMEMIVVLICLGIILLLALLFRISTRGMGRPAVESKSKSNTISPRKFSVFTLNRIASSYGLDRAQAKLLEYVFRSDAVSDPIRVMQNTTLLDRHFKRTFRSIERNSKTDEDTQINLERLFSLRNAIEIGPDIDESSTPRISDQTPAILATGKENYPVKVITSHSKDVTVEIPRNSLGTPVRFSNGAKVTLSFFTKSSNGFSLDSQIIGPVSTDFGPGLQIKHTGKAKPLIKRKFKRKQTDTKCEFFLVNLIESGTGKKKTSKLVVDARKFRGAILDISAGGCSLKTQTPVPVGSRLKIAIDHDENYIINVLGQIIRSNRSASGTIFHIKFLKVPRRAFNSISAMVFGYSDN